MLKPVTAAIVPRTTSTNRPQVMYTPAINLPSDTSEPIPYRPTVNAIAPKAPTGASRMIRPITSNSVSDVMAMTSVTRDTRGPSRSNANPNNTENSSTGRTSPRAKAPTTVSGITPSRKSTVLRCCDAVVYWETKLTSAVSGSNPMPAPGRSSVTTTSPITSAMVETTSK